MCNIVCNIICNILFNIMLNILCNILCNILWSIEFAYSGFKYGRWALEMQYLSAAASLRLKYVCDRDSEMLNLKYVCLEFALKAYLDFKAHIASALLRIIWIRNSTCLPKMFQNAKLGNVPQTFFVDICVMHCKMPTSNSMRCLILWNMFKRDLLRWQ